MAHDALAEFIEAELSGLRRTAYLLCGSWPQADRAVEDALVELRKRGHDFADTPRTLASVRKRIVRACERPDEGVVVPEVDAEDPSDRLAAALASLDHTHRAAVVLGWFARLTDTEMLAALDLGRADVAALKQSALDELRAALAKQGDKLVTDDDKERNADFKRPRGARAADFVDELDLEEPPDSL